MSKRGQFLVSWVALYFILGGACYLLLLCLLPHWLKLSSQLRTPMQPWARICLRLMQLARAGGLPGLGMVFTLSVFAVWRHIYASVQHRREVERQRKFSVEVGG